LDAHIKVFNKAIKVNGEIVEASIISLFGFILRNNVFEWGKNYVKSIQTSLLKSWSKHSASNLE
jgi:hypothetical protein